MLQRKNFTVYANQRINETVAAKNLWRRKSSSHFTRYILEEHRATCYEYRCPIDQYTTQTRFAVTCIGSRVSLLWICFFLEFWNCFVTLSSISNTGWNNICVCKYQLSTVRKYKEREFDYINNVKQELILIVKKYS